MDEPSAQLLLDLRASITRALSHRRPILHHLNADTSWLLQIPRPPSAAKRGRQYYNILIDPWFRGSQTDIAPWFSKQAHAVRSSVQSIGEVEALARQIEILSTDLRVGKGRLPNGYETGSDTISFIDLLAISHEFTDHCHRDTLLEAHPDIPVIAAKKAVPLITSWAHFRTVLEAPLFPSDAAAAAAADWRTTSVYPLPEWLGIARMLSSSDVVDLHSALLITFSASVCAPPKEPASASASTAATANGRRRARTEDEDNSDNAAEAIIYTPHGIPFEDLRPLTSASPPLLPLALLHGLHRVTVAASSKINLGARNGLKAQRMLGARYWFSTHDEVKRGDGIVRWLLGRKKVSVEEAVREERVRGGGWMGKGFEEMVRETRYAELRNGESRILE